VAHWLKESGDLVAAIGESNFSQVLSNSLKEITPFDYTVVFGFLGTAKPQDLFDDFPKRKRKVFVEDYQEGPYLLDPFYMASANLKTPDLYRLRDLAPDRFYQGEYFRNYYMQTGLAEEIGFFIDLPQNAVVCVSLMRAEKAFSAKEFRELKKVWPVVSAACRKNWSDLATKFGEISHTDADTNLPQKIDQAFQTFDGGLLTPREKEVVEFTLKGHSADAVGKILQISPGTVRIHRRNIYAKLRIRSQGELFSRFIQALLGPEV
jgi:DNA-binding CsgD family transcriptional regulator